MKTSDISNKEFFPAELALQILTDLSFEEIVNISLVSKGFKEFTRNNFFGEDKFKLHFLEVYQEILASQKEAADEYARLTEVDKAEFPDIEKQLLERQKPITDWYAQFAKEYTLNGLSPSVREILYSLREGRTKKLSEITFDMLKKRGKNDESIVSFAQKRGDQFLLDYFYQIVEKAYSEFRGEVTDNEGMTLLHWAVMLNQLECIPELLKQYPNLLNQSNLSMTTPLMLAAEEGKQAIVQLLLEQERVQPLIEKYDQAMVRPLHPFSNNILDESWWRRSIAVKYKWTALHFAVYGGHSGIVAALLKHVGGFQALDIKIQHSLAHIAIEKRHVALVKVFIKMNPKLLNLSMSNAIWLFPLAVSRGDNAIVDFLLEELKLSSGENIDQLNISFQDPENPSRNDMEIIHLAFFSGNDAVFKKIANLVSKDQVNLHPDTLFSEDARKKLLLIAVQEGRIALVKKLVEGSQDQANLLKPNATGETPLFLAVEGAHSEIVVFLVRKGAMNKLNDIVKRKLLLSAAKQGYLDIVKKLIPEDPPVDLKLLNAKDKQGETALIWAASSGHLSIAKFLSTKVGIDVLDKDSGGKTALEIAVCNGNVEIVRAIFSCYRDEDKKELLKELLIDAVIEGKVSVVEFLLESKQININFLSGKHDESTTAIGYAAVYKHIHIFDLLCAKGADATFKNKMGQQPIHFAAEQYCVEIVGRLLKNPTLLNVADQDGMTPLMYAIPDSLSSDPSDKNILRTIAFFLKQPGIDVWAKLNMEADRKGWTALHCAVNGKNINVINILLKHILRCDDFPENLVPIDCSQLDKMTGSAIALLQFIVKEAKKEVAVPRSPNLFSDHKRQAILDPRIEENIQAAKVLMDLIVCKHEANSYQNKLSEIKGILDNNAELNNIYDELCEVDSNFKFVPPQLILNQ